MSEMMHGNHKTGKIKIVVIFGGRSGEHAVSLESAKFVLRQLNLNE